MSYKTISIFVQDAERDRFALSAAFQIARREEAYLEITCLGIDPMPVDAVVAGAVPVYMMNGVEEAQENAKTLAEWVKTQIPADLSRVEVQPVAMLNAGLETVVSRYARYADLLILPQPYEEGRNRVVDSLLAGALFNTDAPVLVIPPADLDYSAAFSRALVAWNESDEALSTIRKALPILQAASHTDVVMVDPPTRSAERSDPGGALAMMLSRHGVRADVEILAKTLPKVADILLRYAADHGNDVLVMGAYGHSRLRQAVLGGVTRSMLAGLSLPVLMAH